MPAPVPGPAQAADPDAAARVLEDLRDLDPASHAVLVAPGNRQLVEALAGSAPHLAELIRREAASLAAMLTEGPEPAFAAILAGMAALGPATPRAGIEAGLRRAKRQGALVIAAADVAGIWDVPRVTEAISALAGTALTQATAHLLHGGHASGRFRLPDPADPARGSGLIVLGMGKLGARELNYSSDVDLIILYDHEAGVYRGDDIQGAHVRIARDLVRLMEERSAEGYVFRTDLRLRPDPAATPLALSTDAAAAYYGSLGQNWERAAMIKARPVAGDLAAGAAFLAELRPWIWRKHLDFAAIRDIHAMRRQIFTHKGGAEVAVAGHDVKLGRGGIREIEFFVQTQQLVWGGREPALRTPRTLDALDALALAGKIAPAEAAELARCYAFLRQLEHRLQMIADRQTHRLPEAPGELAALALFLGYRDAATLGKAVLSHLRAVETIYSNTIETGPALSAMGGPAGGSLVFTGKQDDPDTIATLSRMGFANAAAVAGSVRGWHFGRYRATRTARARELLTELTPALLAALGRQREPDLAFTRFDAFLARLPAGVQILSLLRRNPALLDRLAALFGAAAGLADYLARHPAVLDGFLAGNAASGDASAALAPVLADARDYEDVLDGLRRIARERDVLAGIGELDGTLGTDAAAAARSETAEACLEALLPATEADFARRHGRIAGGALAIVALGKLGGREMLWGSDLDLILVYDHDPDAGPSDGEKPLDPPTYFARLAQRVIAAITVPTRSGKLYDVDMRLRPTGSKGPIATSLASFRRYHEAESWTWERMALTRARVVAGPAALRAGIEAVVRATLSRPVAAAEVRADAVSMRQKIAETFRADRQLEIKHRAGGLMELEFIAQALQLIAAPSDPGVPAPSTSAALANLAGAGLIGTDEAAALIAAGRRWRAAISVLRLCAAEAPTVEALAAKVAEALARALLGGRDGGVDRDQLAAQIERDAATVRQAFEAHLGPL
ncbi:MAG: bifunctional [glutamine synthetase] adenylyltransferase/[glutamine synthetase]-adenylyl-L-tyrosine phosphorylase [Acetobacteraceae bacterium]|nr:bifunctional [glutamine synthetase] adenylyltransferase/[glutamine synthetase]-adenylyl-L-tyrosine phosphorylase [Acetobacteraceae bacterium]